MGLGTGDLIPDNTLNINDVGMTGAMNFLLFPIPTEWVVHRIFTRCLLALPWFSQSLPIPEARICCPSMQVCSPRIIHLFVIYFFSIADEDVYKPIINMHYLKKKHWVEGPHDRLIIHRSLSCSTKTIIPLDLRMNQENVIILVKFRI